MNSKLPLATQRDFDPRIAGQAAEWLIELEEASSLCLADFGAWLRKSPQHVEEFLLATAAWREFDDFDSQRRISIQQLVNDAGANVAALTEELSPAAPSPVKSTASARPRRLRWALAAAASVLVAVGVGFFMLPNSADERLITSTGEQRTFKLPDGSVIELNTRSHIEVDYSAHAREVVLHSGEALFTVQRDPARPFRVHAGDTVVQAVGTQFNVYRRDEGTTVSVVEGAVQISDGGAHLAAGEQAQVLESGRVIKTATPDVAKAVAWRTRRLVFRADTLEHIAAEFNRYNTLQIRVEDDSIQDKRLTGVFDADDPQSLLQFLARNPDLVIERGPRLVTIRAY